ncbi:uncharacterized protein METZ01_LOCUS385463, partial [marine metagenome]
HHSLTCQMNRSPWRSEPSPSMLRP